MEVVLIFTQSTGYCSTESVNQRLQANRRTSVNNVLAHVTSDSQSGPVDHLPRIRRTEIFGLFSILNLGGVDRQRSLRSWKDEFQCCLVSGARNWRLMLMAFYAPNPRCSFLMIEQIALVCFTDCCTAESACLCDVVPPQLYGGAAGTFHPFRWKIVVCASLSTTLIICRCHEKWRLPASWRHQLAFVRSFGRLLMLLPVKPMAASIFISDWHRRVRRIKKGKVCISQ